MSWRPLSPRYLPFTLAAALLLAVCVLIVAASAKWVTVRARVETDALSAEQAEQQTRQLAAELQKFRLLPVALSEYPDLHAVLDGGGPKVVRSLNGKLESLANQTDAAEIYVIGRNGRTLAASNWREEGSFVGQNFSFRPYFRNALTNGTAELFAVGLVTGRPGFFIAKRIDEGGRALGVIVVKIDFADMEDQWSRQSGPTMVAESHGVVIITGRDSWRFRALHPFSAAEREDLSRTMQFGSLQLAPLVMHSESNRDIRLPDEEGLYRATTKMPVIEGTRLYHFEPLAPARARAAADARLVALAGLVIVVSIFAIYWRVHMGRLAQIDRRNLLEKEVSLRTAELQEANSRLRSEHQRRMAADARWRAAREELAQANRLGVIGQITTGIAHEINQPVAAIRAFAENARGHLKREDVARTAASLNDIVDLTDRIGRITTELRNFARRGTPVVREASLSGAIDGAILLIADRIRAEGVTLEWGGLKSEVAVVADKMRLEQILINLIQNALDAVRDTPNPRIAIFVEADEGVAVTVADNGPGVSPAMAGSLFTPFATSKPDGLGLGLGIARDIAREFGGSLTKTASPLGGAAFRLTLRRAS